MKIQDAFGDWIIKTALVERAYRRRHVYDVANSCRDKICRDKIAFNLVKHLHYYVLPETKRQCELEINDCIQLIRSTRLTSGKLLPVDTYYNILFTQPLGFRNDLYKIIDEINVDEDMKHASGLISVEELHDVISSIVYDIVYDMVHDQLVDIRYYLNKIY